MPLASPPEFSVDQVRRLWLSRQQLLTLPAPRLTRPRFVKLLESTGGLQVDSVNVLDRAHYLTLWSRFGEYRRALVDRWIYRDQVAYEYWGHEASILPIAHLPCGLRRMKRFPPLRWQQAAYWSRYDTSEESKRRVMRLIKQHGPLMSSDFELSPNDQRRDVLGWGSLLPKEDKRSLQLLWHAGKLAIVGRRNFHKQYDLASRHYPKPKAATLNQYLDSWLHLGLSGCGIASEKHLQNYITGPNLTAPERAAVLERALKRRTIVQVRVDGFSEPFYALPEHLEGLDRLAEPTGLTLICPFDSLLWQRLRAEQLLDFRYRVEIYVPAKKREFGYYVLPILYNGQFVGRLDPKLHRETGELEIRSVHWEPHFRPSRAFRRQLDGKLNELASFVGASAVRCPPS